MKTGRNRWLFRIALLVVLGVAGLIWFTRTNAQDVLIIENSSGQTVTSLRVTLGEHTNNFKDVATGKSVTAGVRSGGKERLVIEGELADGGVIRWRGTVEEKASFVIVPGGHIQMRQPNKG
jgi:hypothetical protein